MIVVREEWYDNNFYTISIEDDMICFGVIHDRCNTLLYFELSELNTEYFVEFTLESFSESINKVDTEFYALLIDTIIESYHCRMAIDEAYILMHQLFAKGFNFGDEDKKYEDGTVGHYLGYEGELFSIELKDGIYGYREFLFTENYYHTFFSTAISSNFTTDILSKINQEALYDKIYSYYVEKQFHKADSPEIEKVLIPIGRKEKIASVLSSPEK